MRRISKIATRPRKPSLRQRSQPTAALAWLPELRLVAINAHGGEAALNVVLLVVGWLRTVGAQAAHETLRDDHFHGGSDQEGLDVHIGQAGECTGASLVCRVLSTR